MLFFSESDVRQLLPMGMAIDRMRKAFAELAAGRAQNQSRRRLVLPSGSVLHSMAGAFGGYFGTKIYSTHPRHGAHFLFALFSAEDARPLALFEANYLGQIRTGAASGFAADVLARRDSETIAVIGTGFQARSQLEGVLAVRSIRNVRVWSRSPAKRRQFADECSAMSGVAIEAVDSAETAVRGADIVVTATSSKEPVLDAEWVAPGAHVNAAGSNQADRRELPAGLVRRADAVVVDSLEQARLESGDLLMALDEAGWARVRELKDVTGRPADRGAITIFKSNGLGLEDVAAASYVYESAGEGTRTLPLFHS